MRGSGCQDNGTRNKCCNKKETEHKLTLYGVVIYSGTGQPKNGKDYITPTYNCEELDSRKIKALAEVPDPFEGLGKRISKKWKTRNDVALGTEAAHHSIFGYLAAKKKTAAIPVLEDAATGDELDFENSQELLSFMKNLKKKDINLK